MVNGQEVIGQVFGDTSSRFINCRINGPYKVKRGEFVKIIHKENIDDKPSWLICRVYKIGRYNPLFTEDLITSEELPSDYLVPESKSEEITAKLEILGLLKIPSGNLVYSRVPIKPGAIVYKIDRETMSVIFSSDVSSSLLLGRLIGYETADTSIPVYVSINDLVTQHLAVLAMTGAGKSYTVGRIMEGLLAQVNARILVLDIHGEYGYMYYQGEMRTNNDPLADREYSQERTKLIEKIREKKSLGGGIKVFCPESKSAIQKYGYGNYQSLRLKLDSLSQELLSTILPGLTEPQHRVLNLALKAWFDEPEPRNPDQLLSLLRNPEKLAHISELSEIERKAVSSRSAAIVALRLRNLIEDTGVFYTGTIGRPTEIEDIVGTIEDRAGHITIVDFLDMPIEYCQVASAVILNQLLMKSKIPNRKIPNVFTVVEEAHNYIPQSGSPVCKDTLIRIISEGRKFGLGICAISQRPSRIDSDVLSQCNSFITMRMKNPEDLSFVSGVAEYASSTDLEEIPALSTGEALVFGKAFPLSLLVKIGPRHLRHGGVTPDVISGWRA